MTSINKIENSIRQNGRNVKFNDLKKLCDYYFGKPRQNGTSHMVYKTTWVGKPYVNIQRSGVNAKDYQVNQVIEAIDIIKRSNKNGDI